MKSVSVASLALACSALALAAGPAAADAVIGKAAPAFQVLGADGKTHSLNQYKGKTVVLEWTNKDCPYVRKHYNTANMQDHQADAAGSGVVWLQVISSAPGKQGHMTPAQVKAWKSEARIAASQTLLDPSGTMGQAYGARTTPHMYVIDKTGKLVYMGGIDDKATPFLNATQAKTDVAAAKPYVKLALADVAAGRPVAQAVTRPYGCSVKYPGVD